MLLREWHPIQNMLTVQEEINRIFNEALGAARPQGPETASTTAWSPRLDMAETGENFIVYVDLPGVKQEDIELTIEDNSLLIKGVKPGIESKDGETIHRAERSAGNFYRAIPLPASVDSENIKASLKDGVLEVYLAKVEQAKPRRIEISTG